MTVINYNEPPPEKKGFEIPTWAGIVALLVILLGIGWFCYWFLFGSTPKQRTITVDPSQTVPDYRAQRTARGGGSPVGAVLRQLGQGRLLTGVTMMREGQWQVRSSTASMLVNKTPQGNYDYQFMYTNALGLTVEQANLLVAKMRILRDDAMAKELKVTPEQLNALRGVPQIATMQLAGADRDRLTNLWTTYAGASDGTAKTDAEKNLVAALEDVAKKSLEPTKAVAMERVKQVQGILTAEQVDKLTKR